MAEVSAAWTDAGQANLVALIASTGVEKWVSWGSGTTPAAVGQTGLVSAHPEARVAGTISNPDASTHRVVAVIEASAARDVSEVALWTASSGGPMTVRGTHTTRNLVAGDQIRYTIDRAHRDSSES